MNRKRNLRKKTKKTSSKRGNKSTRVPRGITAAPGQMCRIVETINLDNINPNTNYLNTFQLNQFRRAHYMSAAFAFYKAAKVTYTYTPLFNTFQDVSGSSSAPNIFTLMNRQGDTNLPQSNIDVIAATGARPKRFVGVHKVSYVPNWTTPGLPVQTLGGSPPILQVSQYFMGSQVCYNWINKSSKGQKVYPPGSGSNDSGLLTQPPPDGTTFPGVSWVSSGSACDGVAYLGHDTFVQQAVDANPAPVAACTITVEWVFKGPVWNNLIRQEVITV